MRADSLSVELVLLNSKGVETKKVIVCQQSDLQLGLTCKCGVV